MEVKTADDVSMEEAVKDFCDCLQRARQIKTKPSNKKWNKGKGKGLYIHVEGKNKTPGFHSM